MIPYIEEILIGAGAIIVLLIIFIVRLEIRLNRVLRGSKAKNLDESISMIEDDIKKLSSFRTEVTAYLSKLEKRVSKSIQGVSTIRFNPFKGTGSGGNQSFASSLVSEKGDGVIISTLYSREHVSVYAKPVKNFSSEYELTKEEKDSLSGAKEIIKSEPKEN